jgi:hypothetical protein
MRLLDRVNEVRLPTPYKSSANDVYTYIVRILSLPFQNAMCEELPMIKLKGPTAQLSFIYEVYFLFTSVCEPRETRETCRQNIVWYDVLPHCTFRLSTVSEVCNP